ncbi:precorrin-2 dehydrogenase / sirohydrochlorin ferrochelatase [Vibrio xiamenensis]|uniref:precorrin-2 dehydrogenase n=1 Tax=Vibrio xiamenensis TaxID=861298 RepID=A0A1G7YFJ2_9VIBR|nr:bifunctional precorrin-2 dehydrogenase/sirohydrochlorin ferrochelatase [Vibrio xiamenensis]SDG95095.1 precorrin-2 dehydrogenase / sirohydrochlorin ferrochelatase [Vibrio xiamenensis]
MQYFPLFLDLSNRAVLVVGGGEVACRKIDSLLRAGAQVTIISPNIEPYLQRLVEQDKCVWIQNFYSSEHIRAEYVQVWATTNNPELNHQVYADAKKARILVNVVDDQPFCDFITPAMVNRGRIQLAISSGGASPVLVRNIREQLESMFAQNLGYQAEYAASKRNDIKRVLPSVDDRRKFWERFFDHPDIEHCKTRQQFETLYQEMLYAEVEDKASITWIEYGEDVELLPLKALRLMQRAEKIFHEQFCPFGFVDLVRRDAEREGFISEIELAAFLEDVRRDKLRVCVFIPPNSTKYHLLRGDDLFIRLGKA